MEIEQRWVGIFTSIAKEGAFTYTDLKHFDAFEFFHVFKNHLERQKKQERR